MYEKEQARLQVCPFPGVLTCSSISIVEGLLI
jgi:hypothetical protein